jgi:hypothetical protein
VKSDDMATDRLLAPEKTRSVSQDALRIGRLQTGRGEGQSGAETKGETSGVTCTWRDRERVGG